LENEVALRARPIILIVEKDPSITRAYEGMVAAAGFTVGASFLDCAAALEWLSTHNPDGAVIDVNLHDEDCITLARKLLAREIPFLAVSRTSARSLGLDPVFWSVPWLKKPVRATMMQLALHAFLQTDCDQTLSLT
jgi:DNA-binding response OmpR family regulator